MNHSMQLLMHVGESLVVQDLGHLCNISDNWLHSFCLEMSCNAKLIPEGAPDSPFA